MSSKTLKVGEHVEFISGFPFSSAFFNTEDGFPLIRIRDLNNGSTDTYYNGPYSDLFLIKDGDTLVGMDGDFHIVKWKGRDALLNQRVLKIIAKKNSSISQDYLFYWLQPYLKHINDITAATTVKHLSVKDVHNAEIDFIDIEEQEKIGSVLSTTDNLIEKTENLIAKYQSIKLGLMNDLFTRGIDESGKLRPPVAEAPELYKESELGWIPKEWRVCALGEVANGGLKNGFFKSPDAVGRGFKLINVSELYQELGIDTDYKDVERVEAEASDLVKYGADEGDLFFTRSSLVLEGIARCNILVDKKEETLFECHVMRLRPNSEMINPSFLAWQMQLDGSRKAVMARAKQVTMTTISQPDLASVPILIPQIEEQERIQDRLWRCEKVLQEQLGYLEKIKQLKKGLMNDLLTGKVRVKVKEKKAA